MSHEDGAMDRRLLLGAAGLAGIAALSRIAHAGPVNPPVGPVGPTGRTLDEVYNKIPGANGSGDGRIPIPGGATANITQPGSYVLTGNLTGTTGALGISASDVALDLNGYTVSCSSSATNSYPVIIANGAQRVLVRNGTVVGGQYGIGVGGALALADLTFEDLLLLNQRHRGISLTIGGIDRTRVRRCGVYGLGSGTNGDVSPPLIGIIAAGTNVRVEECAVGGMASLGTGTPSYTGIQAGGVGGAVVSRCTVTNATTLAGIGILVQGTGVYRDNTVVGFGSGYVGGTNGGGNV